MPRLRIRGAVFDMYGTVVDVGAAADACREVAPDPAAFTALWRAKQLEYSFDVVGGKAYGFRVCWINRTGAPLDPLGPKPDLVVTNFDELSAALT